MLIPLCMHTPCDTAAKRREECVLELIFFKKIFLLMIFLNLFGGSVEI